MLTTRCAPNAVTSSVPGGRQLVGGNAIGIRRGEGFHANPDDILKAVLDSAAKTPVSHDAVNIGERQRAAQNALYLIRSRAHDPDFLAKLLHFRNRLSEDTFADVVRLLLQNESVSIEVLTDLLEARFGLLSSQQIDSIKAKVARLINEGSPANEQGMLRLLSLYPLDEVLVDSVLRRYLAFVTAEPDTAKRLACLKELIENPTLSNKALALIVPRYLNEDPGFHDLMNFACCRVIAVDVRQNVWDFLATKAASGALNEVELLRILGSDSGGAPVDRKVFIASLIAKIGKHAVDQKVHCEILEKLVADPHSPEDLRDSCARELVSLHKHSAAALLELLLHQSCALWTAKYVAEALSGKSLSQAQVKRYDAVLRSPLHQVKRDVAEKIADWFAMQWVGQGVDTWEKLHALATSKDLSIPYMVRSAARVQYVSMGPLDSAFLLAFLFDKAVCCRSREYCLNRLLEVHKNVPLEASQILAVMCDNNISICLRKSFVTQLIKASQEFPLKGAWLREELIEPELREAMMETCLNSQQLTIDTVFQIWAEPSLPTTLRRMVEASLVANYKQLNEDQVCQVLADIKYTPMLTDLLLAQLKHLVGLDSKKLAAIINKFEFNEYISTMLASRLKEIDLIVPYVKKPTVFDTDSLLWLLHCPTGSRFYCLLTTSGIAYVHPGVHVHDSFSPAMWSFIDKKGIGEALNGRGGHMILADRLGIPYQKDDQSDYRSGDVLGFSLRKTADGTFVMDADRSYFNGTITPGRALPTEIKAHIETSLFDLAPSVRRAQLREKARMARMYRDEAEPKPHGAFEIWQMLVGWLLNPGSQLSQEELNQMGHLKTRLAGLRAQYGDRPILSELSSMVELIASSPKVLVTNVHSPWTAVHARRLVRGIHQGLASVVRVVDPEQGVEGIEAEWKSGVPQKLAVKRKGVSGVIKLDLVFGTSGHSGPEKIATYAEQGVYQLQVFHKPTDGSTKKLIYEIPGFGPGYKGVDLAIPYKVDGIDHPDVLTVGLELRNLPPGDIEIRGWPHGSAKDIGYIEGRVTEVTVEDEPKSEASESPNGLLHWSTWRKWGSDVAAAIVLRIS